MSFRHKLLACFTSLLALVLGLALWTLERSERRRAERDTLIGLEAANTLFQEILAVRQRELSSSLQLLSGDFAFKQAVATGEPATVLSAARNLRARIGAELLLVADSDGKALADTRGRLKPGRDLAALKPVRSALEEKTDAGIQLLEGSPVLLAAVPITGPDLIGVLAAGFEIDDALAASLKRVTGTEVAFLGRDAVFASTLTGERRDALLGALGGEPEGRPRLVALAGERYLARLAPRGEGVSVLVARSWDAALEPSRQLRQLLLMIGAVGLVVCLVIGTLIADRVTKSLSELSSAAGEVARGRYDVKLEIRSIDEIGQLGRSFVSMARGLAEREKIRSVLRKAVSKEIAESLLAQGKIELGGEERTVTTLFSDIRSFTTISEATQPKELVTQLNAYFTAMSRAIEARHGVVDKFIGDAIMALFGAPLKGESDAENAVRAALGMRDALAALNAERVRAGLPRWKTGVGLNTGTVVAGTLGSEDRWSYTVIGDGVNLASRLEGLTKHYGADIIVSESTRDAAPGFVYRTLDRVIVQGRKDAVQIFQPLGEGTPPAWLADFEEGLRLYRARDWDGAGKRFEAVLAAVPDDGPARMYLERAAAMRLGKSSGGGDEPTRMTEK